MTHVRELYSELQSRCSSNTRIRNFDGTMSLHESRKQSFSGKLVRLFVIEITMGERLLLGCSFNCRRKSYMHPKQGPGKADLFIT